jgi:hypothetical protein
MPMPRDAATSAAQVGELIDGVRRRRATRQRLEAGAAALVTFTILAVAARMAGAGPAPRMFAAAIVSGLVATGLWRRGSPRRTAPAIARAIERSYPSLRNLAVTAEELIANPDRARPYMRAAVLQSAARAMTGLDVARVVPIRRQVIGFGAAVLVLFFGLPYSRVSLPAEAPAVMTAASKPAVNGDLDIDVVPPAYTGRPSQHLRNPQTLDALAGSIATIRLHSDAAISVRLNGVPLAVNSGESRATLVESGYLAVDTGTIHRLLPLAVTPDAVPDVRVTAPGRDLRVSDTKTPITIHATATDDLALRAFELRYTIVSGGGEQFSFSEGAMPATVVKDSDRAWRADAALSLSALKLEPGDALVYRAVAADARPGGAGESSSDTYFVEIAGPGDVALEGVDMPPDKERYALSEAMVVVKIQRLIAREPSMRRAEVEDAAGTVAAEQRAVRANFIFMLGGEVEDEVVEAETSHEIQEGRLANQARKDIVAATVLMAKVEQALAAVSTRTALPLAQEAVRTLQRAFGHSRYLLRALPARIRIDPARRLSGDLAAVRDWPRDLVSPAPDPRVAAARAALAGVMTLADARAAPDGDQLARLAERVLAIEPTAADAQQASRALLEARDLFVARQPDRARQALDRAASALLPRAQRGRIDVPGVAAEAARLTGAAAMAGGGPR